MIQAQELRVGNWVTVNGVNQKIDGQDIYWFDWDLVGPDNHKVEPIELTPEILEKAGFEEVYRSKWTLAFDLSTNTKIGAGWNLAEKYFYVRYLNERFYDRKYLHTLQNFVFALTGQELEINLL